MNVELLDHVTLNTRHLDECIQFYGEVLGMENGPRPDFGFPGAWMYLEGRPVVHIMALDNARGGTSGPVDHIAFRCKGFDEVKARLIEAGYEVGQNIVADFKIKQLYIDDPDGVKIELNFLGE